jgi:3-deoxy-D-manno-octulosonate 8-phosphate phosphatase (KDO 8-P phosphatase)
MIFKNKSFADVSAAKIKLVIADNDGTLTPGHTFYSKFGEEFKMYSHRDGRGVNLLKKAGLKFGIITGERSEIVSRRSEKLDSDFILLGIEDKAYALKSICIEYGLDENQVAFIGDDTNDLDVMDKVGLSFAVNDAHDDVLAKADIVCENKGGCGALREAIDYIIAKI